jgi:hypothetical protein
MIFEFTGQYLLADSAYNLTRTVIPNSPSAELNINTNSNYCLAKDQVIKEHTIGCLKSTMKPIQSNTLLADLLDWIVFLCPVLKNKGLDCPSNPIPWYWIGIGIALKSQSNTQNLRATCLMLWYNPKCIQSDQK